MAAVALLYGLIEGLRAATGKKYLELIHRIDRDTSGLVMISKKRSTLKTLQDLLREHKIQKTYAAIVKGQVSLDKQLIDAPLHRYELANGERRVRVSQKKAKRLKPSGMWLSVLCMRAWCMLRRCLDVPINSCAWFKHWASVGGR